MLLVLNESQALLKVLEGCMEKGRDVDLDSVSVALGVVGRMLGEVAESVESV